MVRSNDTQGWLEVRGRRGCECAEQDLAVTGRQFATADAPNVAGLRRAAPGGPAAMQVALSGKGAGFLELARFSNNARPHVRVRHRHSGAGTYAALHRNNTSSAPRGMLHA